jgi:1,4-dihydroxy-2-naphthoate octaprenyltransferase
MNKFYLKCDVDGKILFLDNTFLNKFTIKKEDFIIKKRIFNLLHYDFIIDFIKKFNNFINNDKSSFIFSAALNIDNHSNYICKIFLRKKENIDVFIYLNNKIYFSNMFSNFFKKLNFILRTKFVFGSLIPFCFCIIFSFDNLSCDIKEIFILLLGLLSFHISANTLNDYFDWKSKRDQINIDYVILNTGGSRSIDFKLISENNLLYLSIFFLLIVVISGYYFFITKGVIILKMGLIGIFSVYFYSAPPIHLASRYGLGELMHIICLGPLIIYGCLKILVNNIDLDYYLILLSFPFGLLITNCLLMNEIPDSKYDKLSKKNNLAVIINKKYIYILSLLLLFTSFFLVFITIYFKYIQIYLINIVFLIPYIYFYLFYVKNIENSRFFISKSCIKGFNIYLYFSLMLIFSFIGDIII